MAQKRYDQIHETVLKDICDIFEMLNGLSDEDFAGFVKRHKQGRSIRSIARASNDLICAFPVISSRNIAIDNQAMVSKAIEKNCVSMLQILFSAMQLTTADNAIDFIRQFHTNINKSAKMMDLDDMIDIADAIAESAVKAGAKVDYDVINAVKEDMKNLNFVLPDDINPVSISEAFECNLTPDGRYKIEVVSEKSGFQKYKDKQKREAEIAKKANADNFSGDDNSKVAPTVVNPSSAALQQDFDPTPDYDAIFNTDLESLSDQEKDRIIANNKRYINSLEKEINTLGQNYLGMSNQRNSAVQAQRKAEGERAEARDYLNNIASRYVDAQEELYKQDTRIRSLEVKDSKKTEKLRKEYEKSAKLKKELDDLKSEYEKTAEKLKKIDMEDRNRRMAKDYADIAKNQAEFFNKQVLNSEYKKANELQPTLMVVNFKSRTGDGYETVDSVVIGVKAKLYPIDSTDIITHVVSKTKDANFFHNFIKASTREISFFKDFLFSVDKAKIDALSYSKKGSASKMWKVLERRAFKSKWNRLMAKSNDATAITTLMVSQNEVDFMNKEYNVDLADVQIARMLLEKYNFLGIIIVDEALEVAKFMWDTGEDMWETLAFSHLERESNDNTYKKVVNLMTRVM